MFKPALLRSLSKELVDVVGIPGQDPVPENKSSMKMEHMQELRTIIENSLLI